MRSSRLLLKSPEPSFQAMTPTTSTTPTPAARMYQRALPLRRDRRDDRAGPPLNFRFSRGRSGQELRLAGGRSSGRCAGGLTGSGVAVAGCVIIDPNSTGIKGHDLEVKEQLHSLCMVVDPKGVNLALRLVQLLLRALQLLSQGGCRSGLSAAAWRTYGTGRRSGLTEGFEGLLDVLVSKDNLLLLNSIRFGEHTQLANVGPNVVQDGVFR